MDVTAYKEGHAMRGDDRQQAGMFSYIAPEARVPQDHPLRVMRTMVDRVLAELSQHPRHTGHDHCSRA